MPSFSRREFLKLSALLPAGLAVAPWLARQISTRGHPQASAPKNVIIILFDAMSARNLSVYDYPRSTTPNLIRFAGRANVYHSHYSAANFTIPGTTSLLTGLYPWTHRGINLAGMMRRELTGQNIFKLMHGRYQRLGFGQNLWANFILDQFRNDLDIHLDPQSFSIANGVVGNWFNNDRSTSDRSFDDFLFKVGNKTNNPVPGSLIFGIIERLSYLRRLTGEQNVYSQQYPLGLPNVADYPVYFRMEDLFKGVISDVQTMQSPTFAYFHLYPPHQPYRPSKEFFARFFDNYQPLQKPDHPLDGSKGPQAELNGARRRYDQYIADLDAHFGRLLDTLQQGGLLDNSVVVVTADHGQMFERGVQGHETPLMYDPVLRIPLLISSPGQNTQVDIQDPTNSVDVLPSLLRLTGQPAPAWCEGSLLPGLGGQYDPNRSSFSVEAKLNAAYAPLKTATIAMRKGPYKLIHYLGYGGAYQDAFELYDLENDLEEIHDLYPSQPAVAAPLKDELLTRLAESNSHFGT